MSSESRWHEGAQAEIERLSADAGCPLPPTKRRRWLLDRTPEQFATGYPWLVWVHEVRAATVGLPAITRAPLKGEWPMTEAQKKFFAE
jgi:hypothetical protein